MGIRLGADLTLAFAFPRARVAALNNSLLRAVARLCRVCLRTTAASRTSKDTYEILHFKGASVQPVVRELWLESCTRINTCKGHQKILLRGEGTLQYEIRVFHWIPYWRPMQCLGVPFKPRTAPRKPRCFWNHMLARLFCARSAPRTRAQQQLQLFASQRPAGPFQLPMPKPSSTAMISKRSPWTKRASHVAVLKPHVVAVQPNVWLASTLLAHMTHQARYSKGLILRVGIQ